MDTVNCCICCPLKAFMCVNCFWTKDLLAEHAVCSLLERSRALERFPYFIVVLQAYYGKRTWVGAFAVVQGDPSGSSKPPVDIKTKVVL